MHASPLLSPMRCHGGVVNGVGLMMIDKWCNRRGSWVTWVICQLCDESHGSSWPISISGYGSSMLKLLADAKKFTGPTSACELTYVQVVQVDVHVVQIMFIENRSVEYRWEKAVSQMSPHSNDAQLHIVAFCVPLYHLVLYLQHNQQLRIGLLLTRVKTVQRYTIL